MFCRAALSDHVWPCRRILRGRGVRPRRRLPNGRRIGSLWHFRTPVWWVLHGSLPRSCQWFLGGTRLRPWLSQEHALCSHLKLATKDQEPGSEAPRSLGLDDPSLLKREGRGLKMRSRSGPRMFPNRCGMKEIAGVIFGRPQGDILPPLRVDPKSGGLQPTSAAVLRSRLNYTTRNRCKGLQDC
jgi:hypothetical protein